MFTLQSKKHKNNMIGQTNPTDHQKPVNRKKRTVTGKINKCRIVPSMGLKTNVVLIGANRAGQVGFILRKYTSVKKAIRFCYIANSVKTRNI
jgi:hypothetical protein